MKLNNQISHGVQLYSNSKKKKIIKSQILYTEAKGGTEAEEKYCEFILLQLGSLQRLMNKIWFNLGSQLLCTLLTRGMSGVRK